MTPPTTPRTHPFLDELTARPLVGDGAVGTYLMQLGVEPGTGLERANLGAPQTVAELHRAYVAAGSRVIETNTFSANRLALARHGAEDRVVEINRAGVRLARKAAEGAAAGVAPAAKVYVAGSVGPLPTVDGERLALDEQADVFTEQIEALLDAGVDLLVLETFARLDELLAAVGATRALSDATPLVAQMAYERGGRTAGGDSADEVAERTRRAGVDVVGANCGGGVPSILDALRALAPHGGPMSAFLNAGYPARVEGRQHYIASPAYLAARAVDAVDLGARLVGGCCGTTPETIRAIVAALACKGAAAPSARVSVAPAPPTPAPPPETPVAPPPGVIVELDPPRSLDVGPVLDAARRLAEAGVDAITVADNPLASPRVDNLAVAAMIHRETGVKVVAHLTGRDRNRIGMQSAILGAHVSGLRSLLCVTGDPVRLYHEANTSGVFDLTSVSLVALVAEFNAGRRTGRAATPTAFSIGVALNPNVRSLDGQIAKLRRKITAGAHFALTQPIYEAERWHALRDAMADDGVELPVFVGVMPLVSARMAEYLHNEVPGIRVPEGVRARLAGYPDAADQRRVGLEMAHALIERLAPDVHGIYLVAPRNRVGWIEPLIHTARKATAKRTGTG